MPHRVEDSNKVLGETFEPDTLECENCGQYNSSQLVYCHICAKSVANTDTTSAQKEQLTRQIIESALKDFGIYWRPLKDRGIPSDEASTLKEARNKVKRAKEWGLKNGHPNITTVEEQWDHDDTHGYLKACLKVLRFARGTRLYHSRSRNPTFYQPFEGQWPDVYLLYAVEY